MPYDATYQTLLDVTKEITKWRHITYSLVTNTKILEHIKLFRQTTRGGANL